MCPLATNYQQALPPVSIVHRWPTTKAQAGYQGLIVHGSALATNSTTMSNLPTRMALAAVSALSMEATLVAVATVMPVARNQPIGQTSKTEAMTDPDSTVLPHR